VTLVSLCKRLHDPSASISRLPFTLLYSSIFGSQPVHCGNKLAIVFTYRLFTEPCIPHTIVYTDQICTVIAKKRTRKNFRCANVTTANPRAPVPIDVRMYRVLQRSVLTIARYLQLKSYGMRNRNCMVDTCTT
jgi:hypothetical protein